MDLTSLVGTLLGFGALYLAADLLESVLGALYNGPVLLVILGGSLGAILLHAPQATLGLALVDLAWIYRPPVHRPAETLAEILGWSRVARGEGLLGLEDLVAKVRDPFTQKGLLLVVDGHEPAMIRATLRNEADSYVRRHTAAARVFLSLGGYCPMIALLAGAVGLIPAMVRLPDDSGLGSGLATALAAGIHGLAFAYLLFLPIGHRLLTLVEAQGRYHELVIEGLVAIAQGENPKVIETRLQGLLS
jgi:chemotaxis protein MotA